MTALPDYQPFYLHTPEDFQAEAQRLGVTLPWTHDPAGLLSPLVLKNRSAPNRFCALPISGKDALENGAPGPLTLHRATRNAAGGFGVLWLEATAIAPHYRNDPAQLCLTKINLSAFTDFVANVKSTAAKAGHPPPLLILQLMAHGRLETLSDEDLSILRDQYLASSHLAKQAGFDGIDICCAHRGLLADSLRAHHRPGLYGGDFAGRSRLIREIHEAVAEAFPDFIRAVKMSAYDACTGGFGVDAQDYRQPDLTEPLALAHLLATSGVTLLLLSTNAPRLRGSDEKKSTQPLLSLEPPQDHPLLDIARRLTIAKTIRDAVPKVALVSDGTMWLRQWSLPVAAGGLAEGLFDLAGMGRGALAYPEAPADLKMQGRWLPEKSCMACYACSSLHREGGPTGCPIRDAATYGPVMRHQLRYAPETILRETTRCHQCEAAPCRFASPNHTDYAGICAAWNDGNERKAWELLRSSNLLPELGALAHPFESDIEPACIESSLSGNPIALRDIQWTVARNARAQGWTGVRLPAHDSGLTVAVIGGGPCGLAAAATLLELGHRVELFERTHRLGGMPNLLYARERFPGNQEEIDALLAPALTAGRLRVHLESEVLPDKASAALLENFAAVLWSIGVWGEPAPPLETNGDDAAVTSALQFLQEVHEGVRTKLSGSVAILAGGDAAMEAAQEARRLGAENVYILFPGPRSEMHWHLEESWFAQTGVHALILTRPLKLETDASGNITGIIVAPQSPQGEIQKNVSYRLEVQAVIHASGLQNEIAKTGDAELLSSKTFSAGGMINGGAAVSLCVAEGMATARKIHGGLMKSCN